MIWPRSIDCTINYGDEKDTVETSAKLLRTVETYGEYGPMAEYESEQGRFWIEGESMQVWLENKQRPDIPIEVIAKNESWYDKKEMYEGVKRREAIEQTGLVLPPGFEVPKV